MNYYISEQNGKERNAITKAREDVQDILHELGWKENKIHRKIEGQNKFIHYLRMGFWTIWDWNRILNEIEEEAIMLLQFPMINSLFFNEKAASMLKHTKKSKKLKIILLIHDIDSLRFPEEKKQKKHEEIFWEMADIIIAHNASMKKYLEKTGVKVPIVTLGIFDYLMEEPFEKTFSSKRNQVVIAGNLDVNKANYLKGLDKIKDIEFELYGPNFNSDIQGDNVIYHGVYPANELYKHIDGAWGLVWDGNSISKCDGGYGKYLRYNNPHKLSFYMALGMPVIVWEEAALSDFVVKNNVGIAVKSLEEIPQKIRVISSSQYNDIVKNAKSISCNVRNGLYLENAISKCLKILR